MNKPVFPDYDLYTESADRWDAEVFQAVRNQRNWLLWIAIALSVALVSCGIGFAFLLPLKTSEPYLVKIDKSTGEVEVMTSLSNSPGQLKSLTEDDAVVSAFLVPYIIARETYDKADMSTRFKRVRLFSSDRVYAELENTYRADDDTNPYRRFGEDTVAVTVTRVAYLNNRTAQVGFSTLQKKSVGEVRGKYVATVTFEFVRSPERIEVRWQNPLGFRVTSYRIDQEVLNHG
jgi:type IV secretion system protein VirB8